MTITIKIIITVAVVFLTFILQKVFQKLIDRYVEKNRMSQKRNLAMHKIKSGLIYFTSILAIISIWGFSLENIWVSVAGVLGLVAIGFFAVWSVLSNIFAGMVLFFSQTFRIEDKIEIIPEGIVGRIKDVNAFFIILEDDEGNTITIPNNLLFQKTVKRIMNG